MAVTGPGSGVILNGEEGEDEGAHHDAAGNSPSSRRLHLPFSQSQLSLALSIQKSKPATLSTREYILQFQKHIKRGRPQNKEEQPWVDTASFWKQQCSNAYQEKRQLEIRIAQLELLADHRNATTAISSMDLGVRSILQMQEDTVEGSTADPSLSLTRGISTSLPALRAAIRLHSLCTVKEPCAVELHLSILSCLSHMTASIDEAPDIIAEGMATTVDQVLVDLKSSFDKLVAIFNLCVTGLGTICRDIIGRRIKGGMIYAIVRFYRHCLNTLERFCESLAAGQNSQGPGPTTQRDHHHPVGGHPHICAYATFLLQLLRCVEGRPSNDTQKEVLEGMYAGLLEFTGRAISRAIFREPVSSSKRPGGILPAHAAVDEVGAKRSTEAAGQVFAFLLGAVGLNGEAEDGALLVTRRFDKKTSKSHAGRAKLIARSQRRLQETLLKGIFGDYKDGLVEVLKLPDVLDDEASYVPTEQSGNFIESIWSAVGWDVALCC